MRSAACARPTGAVSTAASDVARIHQWRRPDVETDARRFAEAIENERDSFVLIGKALGKTIMVDNALVLGDEAPVDTKRHVWPLFYTVAIFS